MNVINKLLKYVKITPAKTALIDISRDDEYYTQINNQRLPESACNVTAAINWAKTCKIDVPEKEGVQPEDDLMDLLYSPAAYKHMREVAGWAVGKYPPNEVLIMLEWGINKFLGKKVIKINWTASFRKIIYSITQLKAVIVLGEFEGLHHFTTVCGFETKQLETINSETDIDVDKITRVMVDDSYGDPLTKYKDHRGNSVLLPKKYFLNAVREYKKKGYIWGFFHTDID